jgi:N-acetylneuraminic acid mutarotase
LKRNVLPAQPYSTTTTLVCPAKTIWGIIETCLPTLLLIGLGTGCAGGKKIKSTSETATEPVSPASTTETNGRTSHALSQWLDRKPSASQSPHLPAAGEDCGMIYDPVQHRIVLFGGKDDKNRNLNEVWAFDLTKNIWQKIEVEGESPPESEDHVALYDPISYRMILHGGEKARTTNKIWSFDLKTQHWRNMTDSTAPVREDHTAIFDSRGKRMIIFGGRDNNFVTYETEAFDLDSNSPTFEQWQDLTVTDKHPLERCDHVAVYDSMRNRMIIYGGWNKEEKIYLGDTWAFYFATPPHTLGHWAQIKTKASHPPKRRHAASVYDSARNWFIIFGGFGEEGYLNDVWALDLNLDVWINITPGPQPRIDHQAIYDPQSRRMIIYGGDARIQGKFHDLWELQIQPDLPIELLLKATGEKIESPPKP